MSVESVIVSGTSTQVVASTEDSTVVSVHPVTEVATSEVSTTILIASGSPNVILSGPPGPGGVSVGFYKTAGANLSGHRVVRPSDDGTVDYADSSVVSDLHRALWLTTEAVTTGQPGSVLAYGEMTEPSWSWTPGNPIFLGANGVLTQAVPMTIFVVQVATAETATSLFFDPQPPIRLA